MAKTRTFESTFDTYTTLGLLGQGGAGQIYRVRSGAGEEFALKTLAPARVTSDKLKRFQNEVEFCRRSRHKNVVRVLDDGFSLEKGIKCPFYVMQRYHKTLRSLITEGLHADQVLPLFSQMLDGVEAAHLLSVWHRDLKPENLLLDQDVERLVIADFGIAHFEEEEIYTAVETQAASRLANFLYAAPEQRARGRDVDHRADIYALGLMLNEMFTRSVPQGTEYRTISEVAEDFAYLDELVSAMIRQDPSSRPSTIEEVKGGLLAREKHFILLQKLDAARAEVVPQNAPEEFQPLRILSKDFQDNRLIFTLDRNVPPGWEHEFHQHRGRALVGHTPNTFGIRGNTITKSVSGVPDNWIPQLVEMVEDYVKAANTGHARHLTHLAQEEENRKREEYKKKVADAERRTKVLEMLKPQK